MKDFIRFCIVGAFGFTVNAAMLTFWLKLVGLPLILASLISAEGAFLCTFILHKRWTYTAPVTKTGRQLLVEFHGSAWLGMLLSTLLIYVLVRAGLHFLVAQPRASVIVLFWNFIWTKFYIWRPSVE